jgi:hypothetical protein
MRFSIAWRSSITEQAELWKYYSGALALLSTPEVMIAQHTSHCRYACDHWVNGVVKYLNYCRWYITKHMLMYYWVYIIEHMLMCY